MNPMYSFSSRAIAWMLEHGFDPQQPELPGRYQDTPLILASRQNHEDLVEEFLAAGVDVQQRNMDGTNALWASIVCNSFRIADRLLEAGININNQNDNGATALMYASSSGKSEWVAWLLGRGADTSPQTLDGFSALDLASNIVCLKLLRHHQANTTVSSL
jgi:uncharacterized protein